MRVEDEDWSDDGDEYFLAESREVAEDVVQFGDRQNRGFLHGTLGGWEEVNPQGPSMRSGRSSGRGESDPTTAPYVEPDYSPALGATGGHRSGQTRVMRDATALPRAYAAERRSVRGAARAVGVEGDNTNHLL